MSSKTRKVVVLSDGVDARAFVDEHLRPAAENVVEAVTAMTADDEKLDPEVNPELVEINEELNIVTVGLQAGDVKKFEAKEFADVATVEDDFLVFADADEDADLGAQDAAMLDLSADEEEALDEDYLTKFTFHDIDDFDAHISKLDIQLATTVEPDVVDEPFEEELEELDMGLAADGAVQDRVADADIAGIPYAKLLRIVTCVAKCALREFGHGAEALSDERLNALLREAGMPETARARALARDLITRGLVLIYAPHAWRYSTGAGVRVGVVDTGITPRHPDLRVYGGASYVPRVRSWIDDNGHGTHVGGTIAALHNRRGVIGVAPRARLYAIKVLNRGGSGRLSWILNGLAWCYRARMHVVNLSLGSRGTTHDPRSYSASYERLGRTLRRRGILLVAAAGNARSFVGNPARCPSYLAVSAIDMRRRRASFSCFGPQVELCAPGVAVQSTWPPTGYRSLNGTSMATPHVAGTAALVKARHPGWHGDRIRVHLWRNALDLGRPGRDWFFGYGQVNAYRAVR